MGLSYSVYVGPVILFKVKHYELWREEKKSACMNKGCTLFHQANHYASGNKFCGNCGKEIGSFIHNEPYDSMDWDILWELVESLSDSLSFDENQDEKEHCWFPRLDRDCSIDPKFETGFLLDLLEVNPKEEIDKIKHKFEKEIKTLTDFYQGEP